MSEFNDITNPASSGGDMTGFSSPDEQGVCVPDRRPLSLSWMTDEMLEETRQLWSQRYERDLSTEEAVEILLTAEIKAPFLGLVVVPRDVGAHEVHAQMLHAFQALNPSSPGRNRIARPVPHPEVLELSPPKKDRIPLHEKPS